MLSGKAPNARPSTSTGIFAINVDGTSLTDLTGDSCMNSQFSLSPDGTRIVFRRNCGPTDFDDKIWLMDVDGTDQRLLTTAAIVNGDPTGNKHATPDFSQRGFRYCEVSVHGDWQGELVLGGLACHDAAEPAATFACSHAGLSDLFAACVRTFRQNLAGLLRDCPQRDERLGWLGDAHAVMPAVLQCTDSAAILARWLRLIAQTQDPGSGRRTQRYLINPAIHQRKADAA